MAFLSVVFFLDDRDGLIMDISDRITERINRFMESMEGVFVHIKVIAVTLERAVGDIVLMVMVVMMVIIGMHNKMLLRMITGIVDMAFSMNVVSMSFGGRSVEVITNTVDTR